MLIFQVICLIFIAYNIFYIIVGLDTIRNLKRKAFLNEVMGIDVRNTVISIKDKLSTFVFRIIVCSFIIIYHYHDLCYHWIYHFLFIC